MAPTFWTAVLSLVVGYLANQGIHIDTDDLVTTVNTLVLIGGPILIMFRQWYTGRSTWFGTRPRK